MFKTVNIFDIYGVDQYADLTVASVDPQFRGLGLATEMYKRTLELLKSKRIPVAKSSFSSPYTRKIAQKFGFEQIRRDYFKDFRDENGEKFFHNADDQFSDLMAIRLIN